MVFSPFQPPSLEMFCAKHLQSADHIVFFTVNSPFSIWVSLIWINFYRLSSCPSESRHFRGNTVYPIFRYFLEVKHQHNFFSWRTCFPPAPAPQSSQESAAPSGEVLGPLDRCDSCWEKRWRRTGRCDLGPLGASQHFFGWENGMISSYDRIILSWDYLYSHITLLCVIVIDYVHIDWYNHDIYIYMYKRKIIK